MNAMSSALAVVTGAATGIGRALAREAAARGAEVVVIDVDDPTETTEIIASEGGRARGAVADVRDVAALQAVAADVCGVDRGVDLVCANAGNGSMGRID